jgi:hypothetical protein
MLNFCGIVVAILKMVIGRNFSMSGINSVKMSAIFTMAAKTRHKIWAVKIQHFPISSKFDIWVGNNVPN